MFVYNIGMIQMMVLLEMSFNVDSLKLFLLWYGDVIVILPETENGLKHSWDLFLHKHFPHEMFTQL